MKSYRHMLFCLLALIGLGSCHKEDKAPFSPRSFQSSFETEEDFAGFYITPQGHKETTFHDLSDSIVHSGSLAHRAWITGVNPPSVTENNNHRGYPTIQLQHFPGGPFETPCLITLWVWLDMELSANPEGIDDWFSFATFTPDVSDEWNRTVLVNLSHEGFVHLQHVPVQGAQEHLFQTSSLPFPQGEWVELTVYLDFSEAGYAKVWQNGTLVSHANVRNVQNQLGQAHFGMYAPPRVASGMVFNDDLRIEMVEGE